MIRFLILVCSLLLIGCGSSKKVHTKKKTPYSKSKTYKPKPTVSKNEAKLPVKPKSEVEKLEATSNIETTSDVILKYIDAYKDVAKHNMKTYGIPASITLAQGILESGAGKGRLSQIANNHFGIKCHKEWTGPSVSHDDDAAQECFRKYSDPSESFRDHSLFLTSRARYNALFKLPKDDYKAWAKGLRAAGYATDPKYPVKLIGLIERYKLQEIDAEVLKSQPKIYEDVSENSAISHEVVQGDTLYSLSRKYNTSVAEIKKLNNLKSDALSLGQILKIK